MTPFGIIMPSARPAKTIKRGDNRELQIRVRDRRALVFLRDNYMQDKLGPIIATPQRDYNFRAYATHTDFAIAMATMIGEIDYSKFKPEAITDNLHDLYLDIWWTVYQHYKRPEPLRRKGIK